MTSITNQNLLFSTYTLRGSPKERRRSITDVELFPVEVQDTVGVF